MNTKLAWLAGAVALTACQPPPEIDVAGGPRIEILFPPALNESGDGPFELPSNGGTDWSTLVVVGITNLTVVDPYTEENRDTVRDGEGHWHAQYEGNEDPVKEAFHTIELSSAGDGVKAGDLVALTVNLRQNDHSLLLDDNGSAIEDTLEFLLGE